ncbi:cytochrome P450 [Collybia nuda]|uniref:Cytochrome P450 n=1 Tax=Collybia nuda TaxID=64659 RepID=A0A9P5XZT5_9AGAR|nr:cytochrome P450 [Collybia nuda]
MFNFPAFDHLLKFLALAILLKFVHRLLNYTNNWPPGPRGLPIIGNILQLQRLPWFIFTEWKARYGPIMSLNLAGQPMIILNTHKAAIDLLNSRSRIYSDRPRLIMAAEILAGGMNVAAMSYNDRWRRMRRAVHDSLNIGAAEKYRPLQEIEAVRLVNNLLHDPDNWDSHFKRSAASTVLGTAYGWDPIEPKDDPIVERINGITHRSVRAALPGAYLVEIFPVMNHLPTWMAKWKREGLEWFRKDTELFKGFLSDVRKRIAAGNSKPCLASSILENQSKFKLTNKESAWLAGIMFAAGSETTSSALSVFVLAMSLYPDVMREAQTKIDEVVGRDRLPNFEDYDKLPYIHAMVKEVLRWRPVTPLGLPRCAAESDWYEGYYIPKGALVISNVWAMNRDPDVYPDYDEFRPSRFLDASGKVNEKFSDVMPLGHVTFGFGRRICPGMHLGNQSLFMDIACILWALNIDQATDSQGNPIVPSKDDCVDEGIVVKPAQFPCRFTARSKDAIAVLEHAKGDGKPSQF